jgi:hypothetical protein
MPNLSDSCRMVGSPASVKQAARQANMQFPLSLRQFISAPRCPFSKCVRIHLKTLTAPTIPVATMLLRMRQVYSTADIGVQVLTRESLAGIPNFSALNDINVGQCQIGSPTAAQTQLFQNRNNVGQSEIVIYFVRSTVPAFNGCAVSPAGEPGAVVASISSRWTVAHETGHVLGLSHVSGESTNCPSPTPNCCNTPNFTRLMTGCGTSNIPGIPIVVQSEIDTMRSSGLARGC